jgi:DNA-binding protein H-NS
MTIDIESLSLRELGALVVAAEQRKQLISSRRPASAVRRMLKAAAAEAGYTLEELFGGEASETPRPPETRRRKSGKVAPKYRDPEYKRLTWSGRGRMPRWLASKVSMGHKATDFLIPGLARPTAARPASASAPSSRRMRLRRCYPARVFERRSAGWHTRVA